MNEFRDGPAPVPGSTNAPASDRGACKCEDNKRSQTQLAAKRKWSNRKTNGNRTTLCYREAGYFHLFVRQVHQGLSSNREIAEELEISGGYVSKLAKKAASQRLIQIEDGKYYLADEPPPPRGKKSAK